MFKEINVRELDRSPIQMISDDWALLTAGKEGDWNTMTVSWGGVGAVSYTHLGETFFAYKKLLCRAQTRLIQSAVKHGQGGFKPCFCRCV